MENNANKKPVKKLKWGETPWDDLEKAPLIGTIADAYEAIISASGFLQEMERSESELGPSVFWRKGAGAKALEECGQAMIGVTGLNDEFPAPNFTSENSTLGLWLEKDREELTRTMTRLYIALSSAYSIINVTKTFIFENLPMSEITHGPFGPGGPGDAAYDKCRRAVVLAERGHNNEEICRAYTRYARDLLFEPKGALKGGSFGLANWVVCNKCGTMTGDRSNSEKQYDALGQSHTSVIPDVKCDGLFEKLTWEHLAAQN